MNNLLTIRSSSHILSMYNYLSRKANNMKTLSLNIRKGTDSNYCEVTSAEQIKEFLQDEYSWYNIYKVHTHIAALYEVDEDGDVYGDPIATINLPTHDSYSGEEMTNEDDGEVSNMYSRLAAEEFNEDYDGLISEFCETINQ